MQGGARRAARGALARRRGPAGGGSRTFESESRLFCASSAPSTICAVWTVPSRVSAVWTVPSRVRAVLLHVGASPGRRGTRFRGGAERGGATDALGAVGCALRRGPLSQNVKRQRAQPCQSTARWSNPAAAGCRSPRSPPSRRRHLVNVTSSTSAPVQLRELLRGCWHFWLRFPLLFFVGRALSAPSCIMLQCSGRDGRDRR
jgi:hypothetical protein